MEFKTPDIADQFSHLPGKLQEVVRLFDYLAGILGKEVTITRCWDPVPGDSGVHEAHRGVDCRDQVENTRLFSDDDVARIIAAINAFYPRTDGHFTAIHHSFDGMPYHFHFQIPLSWLNSPVTGTALIRPQA